MSQIKYRIKTAIRDNGSEYYQVQFRKFFIWWDDDMTDHWGDIVYFYNLDAAKNYLHEQVANDERAAARNDKVKSFKSRVVYGPYPP